MDFFVVTALLSIILSIISVYLGIYSIYLAHRQSKQKPVLIQTSTSNGHFRMLLFLFIISNLIITVFMIEGFLHPTNRDIFRMALPALVLVEIGILVQITKSFWK